MNTPHAFASHLRLSYLKFVIGHVFLQISTLKLLTLSAACETFDHEGLFKSPFSEFIDFEDVLLGPRLSQRRLKLGTIMMAIMMGSRASLLSLQCWRAASAGSCYSNMG